MLRRVCACNITAGSIRPGELAAGDRLRVPAGARCVPADRINVKTFQTTAILGRNCSRETLLTCFNLHFQLPRGEVTSHLESIAPERLSHPPLPPPADSCPCLLQIQQLRLGGGVWGQGSATRHWPKVKVTTGEVSLECGLHLCRSREADQYKLKRLAVSVASAI